jgi:uncharacterized protein YfaA (DUF2138 family)
MKRTRRTPTIVTVILVLATMLVLYRRTGWAQWQGDVSETAVEISRPDVFVVTRSLSELPRDLIKVPLLHDLLTEDLVFYYEQHPDRLSLSGSLRRIAYEHNLRWSDEVISWALAEPAEAALFRGPAGSLDYWVLAVDRPRLASVVQEAATIALKDRHLAVAGTIAVDGSSVPVYVLEYGRRLSLLVASLGDRVVVLSAPGLLLAANHTVMPAAEATVARLLSADAAKRGVWREALSLRPGESAEQHSVTFSASWLSFGYGRFFPALEALRFDFGGGKWTTQALLKPVAGTSFADHDLWAEVPANPALCALLPLEWSLGNDLTRGASPEVGKAVAALAGGLDGPAAACWYGEGSLQTPLFAGTLRDEGSSLTPAFSTLFNWGVRRAKGERATSPEKGPGGALLWKRELEVPFAKVDEDGRPAPGPMTVTAAREGRHVFFSTDTARVTQALSTVGRRYPNLQEELPPGGVTLGVIGPRALSEIGRKEALLMLPPGDEPVFRTAAERHLLPRLEAVGRYPGYRLTLASAPTARGWSDVEWQALPR